MRSVLGRLVQDIAVAQRHLGTSEVSQLLEANEQLVVSAMRAQTDAESASQALDAAHKSAGLDALTALPNRLLMMDRLAGALANAKRHGTRLGLLFVDLDRFKEINDTLSHAVGDEALKFVARCLESAVRDADTVSRHGGDEFIVLLAEVSHAADAALVAEKMLALLGVPTRIGGHLLRLSASIGISVYPEDGQDANTLIERADAAMYRAKRHGPGSCVFHDDRVGGAPVAPHPASPPAPPPVPDRTKGNADLQEANEQLVLAALSAHELRDAMLQAQCIVQIERERLEVEVARRTAHLVELTHHIETAREEERARLARDLHDELGALLTSAKLDAARIKSRLVGVAPEVLERLAHLVEMLNSGIALKRNIIENLRPSTLGNLGLPATLDILARDFAKRSGIVVHCALEPVRLEEDAELVLYRVVQEAITNIQ